MRIECSKLDAGLPFSASAQDVSTFFKGVQRVDRSCVYFVYDDSGRPSGEAYVYFGSDDGVNAALKKHMSRMGSRYIEMFGSSAAEVTRVARQRKLRIERGDRGQRATNIVSPKELDFAGPATKPQMSAVRGTPGIACMST